MAYTDALRVWVNWLLKLECVAGKFNLYKICEVRVELFNIENLCFSYPVKNAKADNETLKNISLKINEGEYIAVCGKSGSGKSTLLRHLKPALTPHGNRSGAVIYCGAPLGILDLRRQAAEIGFVMQNPDAQIVADKVWHELAFGLESLGEDVGTMRLRVAEMASFFGIQSWFHKNVNELSGGQKQILNLASVMAMSPRALILDEPTAQLDPIAAADFLASVRKVNREIGTTVIISEHRLDDVFESCDRAVVLDGGEIIAHGSPKSVGETLKEISHDMFLTMPAPMQIYAGVKNNLECPLNVREGREWLTEVCGSRDISVREIKEDPERISDSCAVEMKEVWFRYEKDDGDVVKDLSLKVRENEIFAIAGGNGTGKTTALTLMSGVNKPYRGKIRLFGKEINKYGDSLFRKNIALLSQDPQALFVKKSVRADFMEIFDGMPFDPQQQIKMENTAVLLQIDHLLDMHPYDLSGGEMQRAALAKVLLLEPRVLFLDEPTKGLDSYYKAILGGILIKLKEKGATVVFVSHDIEFCAKYADRCALFFDGSIITENAPRKFFSGNSFYTTPANRMSRHIFANAITAEDVITLCRENGAGV